MHFFRKKVLKKFASSKIISTFATANKPSAICPDGGIGRRAGLKHQWSNPSRFDPGSGYNKKVDSLLIINLLSLYTLSIPCFHEKVSAKAGKITKKVRINSFRQISQQSQKYPSPFTNIT
jgi:hypothetical protein